MADPAPISTQPLDPTFYEKVTARAIDNATQLLASCPEMDTVTLVFNWRIKSEDLPTGVTVSRTNTLGPVNLLRAVEQLSVYNSQLFKNVLNASVNQVRQAQQPVAPVPAP